VTGRPLGSQLDPQDPSYRADPYPLYERARREEPVFFAPALDVWVVTRYEDALGVLRDPVRFSSERALRGPTAPLPPEVEACLARGYVETPVVLATDPPVHTRLRGLITSALVRKRIARLAPRIERLADELIDDFAADGEADVIARFAWPLPLRVIGEALGIGRGELAELPKLVDDWIALFRPSQSAAELLRRAHGVLALQQVFTRRFEEAAGAPGDDVSSALLQARQRSAEVTHAELLGVPLALFLGGHLTITRALGNALVAFTNPPARARALVADDDLLAGAVEEALRLESATQAVFRVATTDVVVAGTTVPRGSRVLVHLGSANRDERQFSDPASFVPGRPEFSKHIAFGRGIHFCPGASLARLELKIGLRRLLLRLPNLRRPGSGRADLDPLFLTRGYERLDLAWDAPRRPISPRSTTPVQGRFPSDR